METSVEYFALFVVAFLAATIVPAQSELVLAGMLLTRDFNTLALLGVATAGNTLGSCVNWLLGRFMESFKGRGWFPVSQAHLVRAEAWYQRWGIWSLLLSWAPVVGDALTLIAGILRVPFIPFVLLVLLAKGGRYVILVQSLRAAAGM